MATTAGVVFGAAGALVVIGYGIIKGVNRFRG